MDNKDLNLYKIFLTLYEQKSISKTADVLYVSQPAISYSLKELESRLGYNLFYRNHNGIEPTLEANELYSYIVTAFNIIEDGEEYVRKMNNLNVGVIKIGVQSHIAVFYLSSYISKFRKRYPGIKFEIISKSTVDLVEMLETRKINVIVDTLPIRVKEKSTKKIMLSKLQNCFVYNTNYFKSGCINEEKDLQNYPLILPSKTASIRLKLDEYMESKGIKLSPVIESWTTEFMLEMVKRGDGIGYFTKNVIDMQIDKDNFEVITFNDALPSLELCAVYLEKFETVALKKFIKMMSNKK